VYVSAFLESCYAGVAQLVAHQPSKRTPDSATGAGLNTSESGQAAPSSISSNPADDPALDYDLRAIAAAWPTLREHIRQAILLLVRSAGPGAQP